jgi:K+-sensing histidine kinase KdpD
MNTAGEIELGAWQSRLFRVRRPDVEDSTMTTQNDATRSKTDGVDNLELSQALRLNRSPIVVRYLAAIVMTAVATIVAIGFDSTVTIPNLSLIFVIPVVVAAVTVGLGPSLCSAILGALAYNFFLIEPRYSLAVDDPANIWAIGLLFAVGCIASAVASVARRKADDAELLRQQTAVLRHYSRQAGAGYASSIVSSTADTLETIFQVPTVVILMPESAENVVEKRGKIELLNEVEAQAAQSSLANRRPVTAGVYPFDASRFDFWPIVSPAGQKAVIGLAFDPDERPPAPGNLVEVVGSLFALALDSQHVARPTHT